MPPPLSLISDKAIGLGKIFGALFVMQASVYGVVVTDPTLGSVIDPVGGAEIDAEAVGSTSQSTIEALSGFAVLKDFPGFVASNSGDNTVSFTASTYADIQFTASGSASASSHGNVINSASLATSLDQAIQFRNNSGSNRTLTYVIDFGSYDSGSTGFDPDVNSVTAAGFALTGLTNMTSTGAIVDFYNPAGTIVSTQSVDNTLSNIYFGYDNGVEGISKIRVRTFHPSGISTAAFDDLGFTPATIPEPGTTAALLAGMIGIMAFVSNKRRK
ncbi:PEP-CTERM sorting domain-containing protein [Cerasicoccus arenae]|uniref:PEP-CTERM protein-sorting domain-containing protein n=1 Tax=Cerasicoccus arenae TaxID=424488 RepID=A0A8J3DA83_9BACT|nr:PEP-CTERM sorting domain-containing protein [Cerasicoccus arenae]MBK1859189.1 PEP-CTERM sorting domain-containing protein [Cerasicoccus arenae]GHC01158.1 hypothetical protein GCM10007047_16990 [Cerasicoccus arenae]